MKKSYKCNDILREIVKQQQKEIEHLKSNVIKNEYVIESMQKETDQYVLTCKFLTYTLLMADELEKILANNNSILSQSLQTAIGAFKLELSNAMQTIQYDGGDSFTFAQPYDNNGNGYEG